MQYWRPGEPLLLRHVHGGYVRYALPVTAVEDSHKRVALFLREGTQLRWTTDLQALMSPTTAPDTRWWHSTNVLMLVEPPDAAHSVWLMWNAQSWAFEGWYVNLQRPLMRTSLGFDTWDQSLDIVVDPSLTWSWKDADDFAEVQRLAILDVTEAASVRAEAERVIRRIEARQGPFSADWPAWRPDPRWSLPGLPAGWSGMRGA